MPLSFEEELTFAPKLNELSLKLANDSNRLSIQHRPRQKPSSSLCEFLFQPKCSEKSIKMANKFSSDFLERQLKHVQSQKQKILNGPSTIHPSLQNQNLSEKSLFESILSQPPLGKVIKPGKVTPPPLSPELLRMHNNITRSPPPKMLLKKTDKSGATNSPTDKDVLKNTAQSDSCIMMLRSPTKSVHNSLNRSPTSGLLSPDNENSDSSCSRIRNNTRSSSIRDESFRKMKSIKKVVNLAIKHQRVFVCNGPYSTLRRAMRMRGWIEKSHKKGTSGGLTFRSKKHAIDDETCTTIKHFLEEHEDSKETQDILSRLVRGIDPTFIWTMRRDNIAFRFLADKQIVNHYASAWTFTTKSGLCTHLKKVHHFQPSTSADSFFPRCYRLCCDAEKKDFAHDFRMTAVQAVLKMVVSRADQWKKREEEQNNEETLKKSNNKSGEGLSLKFLDVAIKVCYVYLDSKEHLDIEESYKEHTDPLTWDCIVKNSYKITRKNGYITGAHKRVYECTELLRKLADHFPQMPFDGTRNVWILKPGAKSRGRGIEMKSDLDEILSLSSDTISKKEDRWVIQKYIERPFLIYNTKFDIRQWFLVTDWNPLKLWFYKDSYLRFCGQEFCLDSFDAQCHLSNNAIQRQFKNCTQRSQHLPEHNMWFSDQFKEFLFKRGDKETWDTVIYPGMKQAIVCALCSSQDSLENFRKNSFELYGADFMLSEDLHPWLIEINSSPALGASTPVTKRLCSAVIEDTLKVVLDRREDRNADIGQFELAYKQPFVPVPSYMGWNLSVVGSTIKPPPAPAKCCLDVSKRNGRSKSDGSKKTEGNSSDDNKNNDGNNSDDNKTANDNNSDVSEKGGVNSTADKVYNSETICDENKTSGDKISDVSKKGSENNSDHVQDGENNNDDANVISSGDSTNVKGNRQKVDSNVERTKARKNEEKANIAYHSSKIIKKERGSLSLIRKTSSQQHKQSTNESEEWRRARSIGIRRMKTMPILQQGTSELQQVCSFRVADGDKNIVSVSPFKRRKRLSHKRVPKHSAITPSCPPSQQPVLLGQQCTCCARNTTPSDDEDIPPDHHILTAPLLRYTTKPQQQLLKSKNITPNFDALGSGGGKTKKGANDD